MINVINRRGSLADSIYIPFYLLMVSCTIFIVYYIWVEFVATFTPIATTVNISATENLTSVMTSITGSLGYLDYMFPTLLFGLLITSLVFAFKTGASVIYAYVSIFMWGLALMMSAIYTNMFELFATSFASIGGTFTIMSYIMMHIKWVCLVWAFLISTVMFTRNKQEDQNLASAERVFG